ncbi:hypothetical protein JW933_10425, partial [candidate division FCPU426 bacterium]|nr:hypothetical protein [candidate division FCPU426 bacterium]
VVVVEHNLDVVKTADYVIDLGPEGGDAGGHIIASGPPEDIARCRNSHTGFYLAKVLKQKEQPATIKTPGQESKRMGKHPDR